MGTGLFTGYLFGSIFVGVMCDNFGRKRPLIASSIGLLVFGVLSGMMPNYMSFVIMRTISGFFIGMASVSICVY